MKNYWNIFCRVIDNHGDLGVCWRLSVDLAQRGHFVRLWIDEPSALKWMAPEGCPGVQILAWSSDGIANFIEQNTAFQFGDVVIEAFGCELPNEIQALIMQSPTPVWINLEYLSAENYVARSHGLPSPVMSDPAKGATKWFYFPGFTKDTGGLIRELNLVENQKVFERMKWLKHLAIDEPFSEDERLISLFCYEPQALSVWLQQLSESEIPTRLLVAAGRPNAAVSKALAGLGLSELKLQESIKINRLQISQLPHLSQPDFDHLLWSCDINFVRGEDSLVRALWAGKPFVWHIYPQDDLAHQTKLAAFCDALQMPPDLIAFHQAWNGLENPSKFRPLPDNLADWLTWSQQAKQLLLEQTDLTTKLVKFTARKR